MPSPGRLACLPGQPTRNAFSTKGLQEEQQQQQETGALPASGALDNSLLLNYVASLPFTIPEELPAGVPATALPLHQHFRQVQLQWLASQGRQSSAAPAGQQAGPAPPQPKLELLGATEKCEPHHGAGQQQALGGQQADCCPATQRCTLAGAAAARADDPTLPAAANPLGTIGLSGPLSVRREVQEERSWETESHDITQQAMQLQLSDGGFPKQPPIQPHAEGTEQTGTGRAARTGPNTALRMEHPTPGEPLRRVGSRGGLMSLTLEDATPAKHDDDGTDDEGPEESTADDGSWLASADLVPSHAMQNSSSRGRLMPLKLKDTSPTKLDELEKFAWALVAMLQKGADHVMSIAEVKAWAKAMQPIMQHSPGTMLKCLKAELCRSGFIKYVQLKSKDGKLAPAMRLVLDPSQAVVGPLGTLTSAGQAGVGDRYGDQGAEQQAQQEPSPKQAQQGHSVGGEEEADEDEDEGWLAMVDLKLRPQPGRQLSLPLPLPGRHVSGADLEACPLPERGDELQHQLGLRRGLPPALPQELCMPAIGCNQGGQPLLADSKCVRRKAAPSAGAQAGGAKTQVAEDPAGMQEGGWQGRPALADASYQQPGLVSSGAQGSRKRATVQTPVEGFSEPLSRSKRRRLQRANHAAASKSSGLESKGSAGRPLVAERATEGDKHIKRAHTGQQHQQTLGSGHQGMETQLARPAAASSKPRQRSTQSQRWQGKQPHPQEHSLVGRHMLVFWPKYDAWYEGTVTSCDGRMHDVKYLDGDVGKIDMSKDRVVFLP